MRQGGNSPREITCSQVLRCCAKGAALKDTVRIESDVAHASPDHFRHGMSVLSHRVKAGRGPSAQNGSRVPERVKGQRERERERKREGGGGGWVGGGGLLRVMGGFRGRWTFRYTASTTESSLRRPLSNGYGIHKTDSGLGFRATSLNTF